MISLCFKSQVEKSLTREEKRECIELMLRDEFPLKTVVATTVANVLFALAAIFLELTAIYFHAPWYFLYAGIWTGVFMLFIRVTAIWLICKRTYSSYMTAVIAHAVEFFFTISIISINVLALRHACHTCPEFAYRWTNLAQIGIGVACKVPSFIFVKVLQKLAEMWFEKHLEVKRSLIQDEEAYRSANYDETTNNTSSYQNYDIN